MDYSTMEDDIQKAKEIYLKIRAAIKEIYEYVKNAFIKLCAWIRKYTKEQGHAYFPRAHNYNWHVPIKIEIPKAPYINRPILKVSRSNL